MARTPVVWRFSDAKAGHDSQSRGLVAALARQVPLQCHELRAGAPGQAGRWWLRGCFPAGEHLPAPDLLIGAGHATHLPMLAARRARGGRSVVLMKPSLPRRCFDLCVVPAHDGVRPGTGVWVSEGALSAIRPGRDRDADSGLIVIGGPSRHVHWDDADILRQVEALMRRRPRQWSLTTSRRTPGPLSAELCRRYPDQCRPFAATGVDWLPAQLARAAEVWVSQDSISTIYEALTAGGRVGLLQVRLRRRARVGAALGRLQAAGWVSPPGAEHLAAGPPRPLDEATRCAQWIIKQWLNEN